MSEILSWAIGMATSSIQVLVDQPPGDPYYYAAGYCLNGLADSGVLTLHGERTTITDYDRYYQVQRESAIALLDVYRDADMNEARVIRWNKEHCAPNATVQAIRDRFISQ